MSRCTIAAAACALWLSASPVAAEPFQNFLKMCMGADANAQIAGDAARAAGWTKFPANALGEDDLPFEDAEIYIFQSSTDENKAMVGLEFLLTGWQSGQEILKAEGVRLDLCAIGAPAAADEALVAAMEAHIGFAPVEVGTGPTWMFTREGDRLRSENDLLTAEAEERLEAIRTRKLLVIGIMRRDEMSVLILGAARPEP